jgi:hypothetical protein
MMVRVLRRPRIAIHVEPGAHSHTTTIYLNPAESGITCGAGNNEFLNYYNQERPDSSLHDQSPDEVYYQRRTTQRAA